MIQPFKEWDRTESQKTTHYSDHQISISSEFMTQQASHLQGCEQVTSSRHRLIVQRWRRATASYFLPPALFLLLSVEVPVPPAAACCAFLAAFSSRAFLSLPTTTGSGQGQRQATEIWTCRRRISAPLAALLRGEPVLGVLGVGLPRRRALTVAVTLVAACAQVKEGGTGNRNNETDRDRIQAKDGLEQEFPYAQIHNRGLGRI
jgi:hypothetical protein|uniref:Uncharacterized protein n=1 Tax=Zea mays TaxID=4577 RepID=A0A804QRU0_MAIZE